jgi:hypothetical protein
MRILDYATYEDYGKEWMFQVLKFPKFALLDITVQWDDYGDDKIIPEISLKISTRNLFEFFIRYKWFQLTFNFMNFRPL